MIIFSQPTSDRSQQNDQIFGKKMARVPERCALGWEWGSPSRGQKSRSGGRLAALALPGAPAVGDLSVGGYRTANLRGAVVPIL